MTPLTGLLLLIVGTGLVWVGSVWLERATARVCAGWGFPPAVSGAVLAVGSSFPELTTAVLAPLLHDSFDLGVATIIGSAMFNLLVIPPASQLAAGRPLQSSQMLVYKESVFYLLAVAVLSGTFVTAVLLTGDGTMAGELQPLLAPVPLAVYGLYFLLQSMDARDGSDERSEDPPELVHLLGIPGSLVFVVVGVELLIRAVRGLGGVLGIDDFVWGLTVLAAVTSVPDLFVSVAAARNGRDIESLSNAVGSNTFDLLVCVPLAVLVAGPAAIDLEIVGPLMGALAIATAIVVLMLRFGWSLRWYESVTMLVGYVAFVSAVAWLV